MTTTTLKATFSVPRTKIKNANMALNHIVAAQKSAWIREYAEQVWKDAVKEQHGIVAKEPQAKDLPTFEVSEETQSILDHLEEIDRDLLANANEKALLETLAPTYKATKATLRTLKKDPLKQDEVLKAESEIADYDRRLAEQKAAATRLRATKASVKKRTGKEVARELRKIESAKRRSYIANKLSINSHQQLFKNCAVIIRVNNITDHDFDSPNFYPTVKPILDAATDAAVIWADDNNNVISGGVLFLPGKKSGTKEYVFEIEIVSSWPW